MAEEQQQTLSDEEKREDRLKFIRGSLQASMNFCFARIEEFLDSKPTEDVQVSLSPEQRLFIAQALQTRLLSATSTRDFIPEELIFIDVLSRELQKILPIMMIVDPSKPAPETEPTK